MDHTPHLRARRSRNKSPVVPTIPKRDPRDLDSTARQFTLTLPDWLFEKIEVVAKAEGYTRNDMVREVMRSFVDEWDEAHPVRRGSAK